MTNRHSYKQHVKLKMKTAALSYLKNIQKEHSKVKHIQYDKLNTQQYMVSPLFSNEEVNLLYALRSRSTECKANFKQKYIQTNLLCILCKAEYEDQQHILKCKVLLNEYKTDEVASENVKYDDIFSDNVKKQKVATALFLNLFRIRTNILENPNSQEAPSNTNVLLKLSYNLQPCIVNLSSGK